MKSLRLLAALLALTTLPASAEIIGVDQFDYADGAISGRAGGTFWNYKNTTPTAYNGAASTWDVIAGTPVVSAGRLATSGNAAAKREYRGASETEGAVNDANVAKTVFYRVDVTTGPSVTPADYFGISSMDFGTERLYFGKRGGSTTFGVEEVGAGGTNGGVSIQPNTTYTLVAQVDFPGDRIRLYVNPDLNAAQPLPLNTSTALAAIRTYTGTNWSTAVRFAAGTAVTWDNLVVATTWEDLGTVVTTLVDEDDGINSLASPNDISLREAVNHSPSGTLITFDPGLSGGTITFTHPNGDMEIPQAVTIDASVLPGGITVSGNNTSRHFYVGSGKSLNLRGLTLTGGNGIGAGVNFNSGGAINNDGGTLTLTQCTLSGNSARLSSAGAIFNRFGTLTLTQCTLSGNYAAAGGGAISNFGPLRLSRCTLSGNSASIGGAIDHVGDTLELANSIVAGNYLTGTGSSGADVYNQGTLARVGANLVQSLVNFGSGTVTGPGTISTADPKLSPLAHFGGPVQTMHPLIGSPAIDAADTTDPGGTDARGFPRFVSGDDVVGTRVDIGAVEAGRRLFVNQPGDEPSGNTLRNVIDISGDFGPGTILVCDPSISPLTLTQGDLDTPTGHTLFIDASHIPGGLTISGNNQFRVFNIPATATVAMHSLKIVDGLAPSGAPITLLDSSGGGILNKGTCSVFFSTISGNSATFIGGGIGNLGTCTVHSSTLSGNMAPFGGGGIYNNGTCTVISSTLTGHSVQTGGGIYNERICTVNSSTISGNSASNSGGGLYNNDSIGTFHLSSSIVAGNTAPSSANISNSLASNINNLTSGDPLLFPLGDYGGPTQTMLPRPGSPAIDAAGGRNEVQRITLSSSLPFTLTFKGATTSSFSNVIPPSASAVQNALAALSTIGAGNVLVTSAASGSTTIYTVTFTGNLAAQDQPAITSSIAIGGVVTLVEGTPASLLATDQRGLSRPRDGDGDGNGTALPDFGAVEANIALVTTLADTGPGSLRAALAAVAAQPGPDIIFFDSALSGGTITLANAFEFTDASPVTIDATTLPGGITLNGNNNSLHFSVGSGRSLNLRGLTLTGGGSNIAGAIDNLGGTVTLAHCTLSGNNASQTGGAIWNNGNLTLTHCTLSGNSAGEGGAITNSGGTLRLTHCTLSGNSASSGGGAIYNVMGTLIMHNTIAAGNTAPTGLDVLQSGIIETTGVNLIGDLVGYIDAGSNIIDSDPKLAPLGHYGGPTQTMPPLIGSPAIDAGGSTSSFTTDQRGRPRLMDGNHSGTSEVDIGAVESAFRFVTTTSDDAYGSLRQAISDASSSPGWESIAFASNMNAGTIQLESALSFSDIDGLTIDATNLPGGLTLDAGFTDRHLYSNFGSLTLRGLTFIAGRAVNGGSIANEAALTLDLCTFSGNGSTSYGGAIFNGSPGTLTLTRCTFSGNFAEFGGAILNDFGTISLTHCTLSGNSATRNAGGISNEGPIALGHSIVAGNLLTGTGQGADIFTENMATFTGVNLINDFAGSPIAGPNVISGDARLAPPRQLRRPHPDHGPAPWQSGAQCRHRKHRHRRPAWLPHRRHTRHRSL